MRYIRTKAGEIYHIDDLYVCEELNGKPYGVKDSSWVIYKESIVKQADMIEELCDEFVMFCPNAPRKKIRVYETMSSINLFSKRDKRWNGNMVDKVYGAIWTDKGLIYVAKMNEKGELELL